MYEGLKKPKNLTQYRLMQGVTDFGNLTQFNLYETGYSFLVVCKIPRFIEILRDTSDDNVRQMINNYIHVLEYEFRGLSGIEDITTDPLEVTNGINTLNLIGKVTEQSASTITMQFIEKSGSVITRFHEFFLKGIKDPRTQAKTYYGLIQDGTLEPGYENETFTLLYIVTDNTMLEIEKAYLLLAAQPTKAETSMYESTKGDISNKELSVEYSCFPVTGNTINKKAKEVLDWMNSSENPNKLILQSQNFDYTGTENIKAKKSSTNV